MAEDGLSLNGSSKEFLERFYKLETKFDNEREDTKEMKDDIKVIKESIQVVAGRVAWHDKVIKFTGKVLGALLAAGAVILAAVL